MPKASVIIPCYNAERFVRDTIESVLAQTMDDFEVVCVDDGSTDGTLAVLNELAEQDARIRVITKENGGEGPARDAGRAEATGEWLYFLDADDFMRPTLLEEAIARGEQTKADVVVFKTEELDDQTGEIRESEFCFVCDWIGADVFCPLEHPERIFNSFQNWVHNKLFRHSFVRERGLYFQHVRRSADLLFTCRALAEASRVALLDRPLHLYRVNNPQSALFASDIAPLDFYEGFLALRRALEDAGTWELYHDSYVTWAQEGVAMALERTRSFGDFKLIAQTMRDKGAAALDLMGVPREVAEAMGFIPADRWDRCEAIVTLPLDELIYLYFTKKKVDADFLHNKYSWEHLARLELEDTRDFLEDVLNSTSFKVGRAITAAPRNLRDFVRGKDSQEV